MDRNEIIKFYTSLGFGLFRAIGKRPLETNWHNIWPGSAETDAIGLHQGNIGANIPDDIVILDIDPRNFEAGKNSALELFKACNIKTLKTFKVVTGSGGLHIYLKKPAGALFKKNLDKEGFPGIDIKVRNSGKGMYVIIPPSVHPVSKKKYVFRDEIREIIDLPESLREVMERQSHAVVHGVAEPEKVTMTALDTNRTLYSKWLQTDAPVAVEGQHGDDNTFKIACVGRDYGLDVSNTYYCMLEYWNERCVPPWDEEVLIRKVANAYQYSSGQPGEKDMVSKLDDLKCAEVVNINWDFGKDGMTLKRSLYNVVNFFSLPSSGLRGLLRFNEFTSAIEFEDKPPWQTTFCRRVWSDTDVVACKYYLSSKYSFEVPTQLLDEAAKVQALQNRTHPVREYLNELQWDGIQRLNTWMSKYAKVQDNVFTREAGRKLLVGAVARVYQPGVKFDYVTVIEGKQGMYKSTLISVLGGEWYAEIDIDPRNKDMVHVMNGKWIIELSEMETSQKSEADALKAFITRQNDRIRLPYDRYATDMPRQCVFIGTINPKVGIGYLKDTTGNRRFWCMEVEHHCDTKGLRAVRDQLFAEAVHLWREGEPLYITNPEAEMIARYESEKRSGGDPWQTQILKSLKEDILVKDLTTMNIYTLALGGRPIDFSIREDTRIQRSMKALGWKYVQRERENGIIDGVFIKS